MTPGETGEPKLNSRQFRLRQAAVLGLRQLNLRQDSFNNFSPSAEGLIPVVVVAVTARHLSQGSPHRTF